MVPEISFVDETFDTNITSSYFLSIQVCLDGFSFSILDPVRNKYIQFRYFKFIDAKESDLPALSNKIFEKNQLLNLPYKRVFILIPTRFSTLVPSGLFKAEEAHNWLSFTHQVPNNYKIVNNRMKLADAWNIFAIPQDLERLFNRQYPQPQFFQQYIPMAESKLAVSRPGLGKNQVILNLQKDYFDLIVLEKNNLKLCNSFEITGENDLIYYTLLVFDKLQLTQSHTEIQIIGSHPQKKEMINTLRKYIKQVKKPGLPAGFQYSYLFRDVPGHKFYNLLSIASCV